MSRTATVPPSWRASIDALLSRSPRVILGLAGTPGAGKSSAAAAIAKAYAPSAIVVPMDGFHLANVELERLDRADRKGAPDTFDAAGYIALLARLRSQTGGLVYAPEFRREIEEPIAGAIAVAPHHRIVVTEGNYLLSSGIWAGVRPLLDACWYVDIAPDIRFQRLVARHVAFGKAPDAAHAWVAGSDEKNARLVEETRDLADAHIVWPPGDGA